MKILFVSTDTNPFGQLSSGDAQRTRLLLRACSMIGDVDVVTFAEEAISDIENVHIAYSGPIGNRPVWERRSDKWSCLSPCCTIKSLFPIDRNRERLLDDIIRAINYDLIVVRYLFRAAPCGLLKYADRLAIDFDDDLPFFFLNQLSGRQPLSSRIRLHLSAIKARNLTPRYVTSLRAAFYSEQTAAQRNGGTFLPNIPYYPATCDGADFNTPYRRLLFVGQLDYPPNRDGLDHFLEHVYLPLKKAMTQLEMHITGSLRDKHCAERWQGYPGVTLTGFVDDIQQEYQACHLVVAPIYRCGGSNIKILEALQMGRACVTTSDALAHFRPTLENHTDIVGAATDKEYIDAIKHLVSDSEANSAMAINGRAKVQQHYSFDAFANTVASTLTRQTAPCR
jgi:glycosyltransferase involved in cell wall biosynthesis